MSADPTQFVISKNAELLIIAKRSLYYRHIYNTATVLMYYEYYRYVLSITPAKQHYKIKKFRNTRKLDEIFLMFGKIKSMNFAKFL